MKLPNRTGTVYKLSGKRRNPWIARAYVGKDEYNQRIHKTIGYFRTKTDATRALLAYNTNPYNIDAKKATFADVFELARREKKKDLNPSTIEHNYDRVNKKFFSSLQSEVFADLRPMHYQLLFDEMGKTRKSSYLKKGLSLLSVMYRYAIVNDIVLTDYSKGITIRGQQTEAQDYFTEMEVGKMISLMGTVENADVIVLMCLTGLRPTELLELSTFTVDLKERLIRNVGVKTMAGKQKRVPIARILMPYVEKRYHQAKPWFFVGLKGDKMVYRHFLDYVYKPALSGMGLPYKSPKACRHTFANLTLGKLDDKTRKEIIGHSRIETTNNVYTDVEDALLVEKFQKVEESLTKV